jgi:alpha-amylase
MNYLSSHDDGGPFDAARTKTTRNGYKMLLSGVAQVFYGDESVVL